MLFKADKRASVPADATSPERSGLVRCDGWLKKLSKRGIWQKRYFVLNNSFLVYYASPAKSVPLGALDLAKVRLPLFYLPLTPQCSKAELIDMYTGDINLFF